MKLTYATDISDPITGARPLSRESSVALLHGITRDCNNKIIVFDLDSTLLDNRARNANIMQEFGELNNQALLMQAKADHWQDWSAEKAMAAMGMGSADINNLIDNYTTYWQERFFTSDYCQFDEEVPGAASYVQQLQQSGAVIRYLTGRHEAMRTGTHASLSSLGFPEPGTGNVELIMKSVQSIPDDEYKQNAMRQLGDTTKILAAFDNEPYHINTYRQAFPHATCVHLHTDHSMRPIRLLNEIFSITQFFV